MDTKVYVRDEDKTVKVEITNKNSPEIDDVILDKWQKIIDLVAEILEVPAGLIMRLTEDSIRVLKKSSNEENHFNVDEGSKLGSGIFCESVIGSDEEVLIEDARLLTEWQDYLKEADGMVSYYGLPIHWPDQSFFGTICVLDHKEHHYSEKIKKLMRTFQEAMEDDLKLLTNRQQLNYLANRDRLTGCYNHSAITRKLEMELLRSQRSKVYFSLVFIDIDFFNLVNEKYGYKTGDNILKRVSNLIKAEIRQIDILGRWNGDEFVVICPSTNDVGVNKAIKKLGEKLSNDPMLRQHEVHCSFGASTYRSSKDTVDYLISKAERALHDHKQLNK